MSTADSPRKVPSYFYTTHACARTGQRLSVQALTDHNGGVQFWMDTLPGEQGVVEVTLTEAEGRHLIGVLADALGLKVYSLPGKPEQLTFNF